HGGGAVLRGGRRARLAGFRHAGAGLRLRSGGTVTGSDIPGMVTVDAAGHLATARIPTCTCKPLLRRRQARDRRGVGGRASGAGASAVPVYTGRIVAPPPRPRSPGSNAAAADPERAHGRARPIGTICRHWRIPPMAP